MNTLPNDMLDVIYGMKHALEMKKVCEEIENKKQEDINYLHNLLIDYEYDNNIYYYEPEKIIELITILRNEGEFDESYLRNYIDNIIQNLNEFHNIYDPEISIIDREYYIENKFINSYWYFLKYNNTWT